jgi:hypothetical protein
LLGAGPLRELPPDVWTGTEVAGPRAVVAAVLAVAAVVAVVVRLLRRDPSPTAATVTRASAAAAGSAAAVCGAAALVDRGSTSAPGAWAAVVAGLAAVAAAALLRTPRRCTLRVLATALLAVAASVAVPGGAEAPSRAAAGPFEPVAAIGEWPLRSGSPSLAGPLDDARPVVVDGAAGLLTPAGIEVTDSRGRARVLARTDRGAPPPIGAAGGRLVHWTSADTLVVTGLRADDPLRVLVRDVAAVSALGSDGSIWLRSEIDPPDTVRRLDLTAYDGPQNLAAVYLPLVTIQNPRGETTPIDVRGVLPVPGGALRVGDVAGTRQLQLLTGTAAGIAATPVAGATNPLCAGGLGGLGGAGGDLRALAADGTGVWFPAPGPDGGPVQRLVHLDPDGTARVVAAPLPGHVVALAAPGDGSLLLTVRDPGGDPGDGALWRLPNARTALTDLPPGCTPGR